MVCNCTFVCKCDISSTKEMKMRLCKAFWKAKGCKGVISPGISGDIFMGIPRMFSKFQIDQRDWSLMKFNVFCNMKDL